MKTMMIYLSFGFRRPRPRCAQQRRSLPAQKRDHHKQNDQEFLHHFLRFTDLLPFPPPSTAGKSGISQSQSAAPECCRPGGTAQGGPRRR